jgi:hypothetical protein
MTVMRYYRIVADDAAYADRWFLGNPCTKDGVEILGEAFTEGRAYCGATPATVPIDVPGQPVAFLLASLDMPIVNDSVARIVALSCPDEAEFFPIVVGPDRLRGFQIMNVLHSEACLDESHSTVMWWEEKDCRPDKVGTYRMVTRLTVDAAKTHRRHILRIRGWEIALLASEVLRDELLRSVENLGVVFRCLS